MLGQKKKVCSYFREADGPRDCNSICCARFARMTNYSVQILSFFLIFTSRNVCRGGKGVYYSRELWSSYWRHPNTSVAQMRTRPNNKKRKRKRGSERKNVKLSFAPHVCLHLKQTYMFLLFKQTNFFYGRPRKKKETCFIRFIERARSCELVGSFLCYQREEERSGEAEAGVERGVDEAREPTQRSLSRAIFIHTYCVTCF